MKPKIIAILAVLLLFLIILAQNTHVVTLRLLFWDIAMSQVILLGFAVLLGFTIGYLACFLTRKVGKYH